MKNILFYTLFLFSIIHSQQLFASYDPSSYKHTDPTFPVTYTEAQVTQQRANGIAMMNALKAAAANIANPGYTIAPGVYRIKGGTYTMTNRKNFTIYCANVEIWVEYDAVNKKMQWLTLDNCTNIKIVGPVSFDSEKLQFIQCRVTAWDASKGTIDVKVMDGYDADFTYVLNQVHIYNNNIFHYDTLGVNLTRPFLQSFSSYDAADRTKKRLVVGTDYFKSEGQLLAEGHMILLRNNIGFDNHPVGINTNCTDIEVNGIQCFYGPMWASGWCKGRFANIDCSNYRRPGSNRLGGSEEPGNMDYVNELIYDGCCSGPGQDDGVNALRLMGWSMLQTDRRVLVMNVSPAVGEEIRFYSGDLWEPKGLSKVVSSKILTNSTLKSKYITDFNSWQMAHDYRWRVATTDYLYVVTLDRDMNIPNNSIADCSGNRMRKITARNCYLTDMNVPSFLFRGVDTVLIENNVLERGKWQAIQIEPSRYWWEGPLPHNITISNNIIRNSDNRYGKTIGDAGKVSSLSVGLDGDQSPFKVIENVTITGNTFYNATVNPISVKNSRNVVITNNTFVSPEPEDAHYMQFGQELHCGIFLAADSNVTVSGNQLVSPTPYTTKLVQVGSYMDYTAYKGSDLPTPPVNFIDFYYYEDLPNGFSSIPDLAALKPKSSGYVSNLSLGMAQKIENFGVIFWGDIHIHSEGNYTFYTNSDDFCILYIDGKKVVSSGLWGVEQKGSVSLTPGLHELRVDYAQSFGGKSINVLWEGPDIQKQSLPNSVLFRAQDRQPWKSGITGCYFNGQNFEEQVLVRVDNDISFNWSDASPEAMVDADNFSVRWLGQILPEFSETYTFHLTSDDGSRLWINDSLIIDNGNENTDYSGTVSFVSNQRYSIRLEYFENSGDANCKLEWESKSRSREVVPNARLLPTYAGKGRGLEASYFNDITLTNKVLQRVDEQINFSWNGSSPDPLVNIDNFSARWTGYIQPLYSEEYTFYLKSDNGRRLKLNDQMLIDKWDNTFGAWFNAKVDMESLKKYPITIEYYELNGGADIVLEWESLNQQRQVVPKSQLYHDVPTTIKESGLTTNVSVYPNPAHNELYITTGNSSIDKVKIIDMQGRTIYISDTSFSGVKMVDIQSFARGIYMVKTSNKQTSRSEKIIVN